MYYVEPHIHMVSRITDDYIRMSRAGCVAVSEPAFWARFDRGSAESFHDYFRQLTQFEPQRAAQYDVHHMTWMCVNAKEAENVALSREVLSIMPEFLGKPGVLGIGELGFNKNTKNEAITFLEHVELAMQTDELILIHTPHMEDKYQGTRMTIDLLKADARINPDRVLIDHTEEHTIKLAKDAGFWVGMTLYPVTKVTPDRAVDLLERYGTDRIMVNSAADWGESEPMNVPDTIRIMRARGHDPMTLHKVFYENPLRFFQQSKGYNFKPPIPLT